MTRNFSRTLFVAGLGCLAALFVLELNTNAAQKKNEKEKRILVEFMRKKLGASNRILEGLVTEDFELIQKGADELVTISSAEKWRIINDAMYHQHSNQFTRVAKNLQIVAKEKKLDSCAFLWLEATMSCIQCHKFVRSMMIADNKTSALDDPSLPLVNADPILTVNKLLRADPKDSSEAAR